MRFSYASPARLADIPCLDAASLRAAILTQVSDVEDETNGLMTYDRQYKFDPAFFRRVNERKAAIEE